MGKPRALLTNDDGVDSLFLRAIAEALAEAFELWIAAPAVEQSWIGRAMSRRTSVSVQEVGGLPGPAWAVGGTPTDCVNLALAHLLPEPPDVVISGINIGHNTSLPLLYSSGTVAGALEGANWGLPALAVSQQIAAEAFERVTSGRGALPPEHEPSLREAAAQSARYALTLCGTGNPDLHVHNLNFPMPLRADTPWVRTVPARVRLPGLYEPDDNSGYRFRFAHGEERAGGQVTDRRALEAGKTSLSILNFSAPGASKAQ
ncbi:MAG: 5'/3'-nucleotidase SurE [Opitutales bacterium]|nr:5'/3'-nucleotidase SurE [Opitutales bacterium]